MIITTSCLYIKGIKEHSKEHTGADKCSFANNVIILNHKNIKGNTGAFITYLRLFLCSFRY